MSRGMASLLKRSTISDTSLAVYSSVPVYITTTSYLSVHESTKSVRLSPMRSVETYLIVSFINACLANGQGTVPSSSL